MDDDVKIQFEHDKETLKELKGEHKETSKAIVKMNNQNIRMEDKVDSILTETKSLKKEIAKVQVDVIEINNRPLQTYKKLALALWGAALAIVVFTIESGWTFYLAMLQKGMTK